MITILALVSFVFAAESISLVDANVNVHSQPCRAFGHVEVVVDGVTGITTPRTDCIGRGALNDLTDDNVKTTLANVEVTKANTNQLLALNEQTFDQQQQQLQIQAHLAAYKACLKSMEGDGNVTCSIDGDVIKRVSDPVGEAQANGVNRWPTNGYGALSYGNGPISTSQILDQMAAQEWADNHPGGQTTSGGRSTGDKNPDKPMPPPLTPEQEFEKELGGS